MRRGKIMGQAGISACLKKRELDRILPQIQMQSGIFSLRGIDLSRFLVYKTVRIQAVWAAQGVSGILPAKERGIYGQYGFGQKGGA
ncbi:hypothetical protein [Candidatus Tokpelaia sp.]|uniref:hypothetical protein n=1 Tax=Candidatus Tokpelaia sp. TaxID=2233777 RepID=UPI0012394072|nr:hypothetical protein [Candidatus Tokpelaia sp.]